MSTPTDDGAAYAQLWLAELGAHTPQHGDGTLARYGLNLTEPARAARNSERLTQEGRRVRARSDGPGRRA